MIHGLTSENLNLATGETRDAATTATRVRRATTSPAAAEGLPCRLWLAGFVAAFFAFGAAPAIVDAVRALAPEATIAAPVISVAQTAR